jgi:hypothetical protein
MKGANMINGFSFVAVQAYGRRSTNEDNVRKQWEDGKDFQAMGSGQYFSKRDVGLIKTDGFTNILVHLPEGKSLMIDLI